MTRKLEIKQLIKVCLIKTKNEIDSSVHGGRLHDIVTNAYNLIENAKEISAYIKELEELKEN
jgi:hypothetical protein